MKGFLVDIEFMWGFQARVVGMSKTAPSFPLPPPTTILGAIAEVYARKKKLSESYSATTMKELARNVLTLTYKPLNAIPLTYEDLNRIIAVRIAGGIKYPSTLDPYGSFDAPARGKTILSALDNNPPILRVLAVFKDSADLSSEDLWKIKRIGSKESLVCVVDVKEEKPEILRGVISTDYMLPLTREIEQSLIDRGGSIELEFVPVTSLATGRSPSEEYLECRTLKHLVSLPLQRKVKVRLPTGYVGYKIKEEVAIGLES